MVTLGFSALYFATVSSIHFWAPGASCSPHHHTTNFTGSAGFSVGLGGSVAFSVAVGVLVAQAEIARLKTTRTVMNRKIFFILLPPYFSKRICDEWENSIGLGNEIGLSDAPPFPKIFAGYENVYIISLT
jgi:hypothetical protein